MINLRHPCVSILSEQQKCRELAGRSGDQGEVLRSLLIIKAEAASCVWSLGFRTWEPVDNLSTWAVHLDLPAAVRSLPSIPREPTNSHPSGCVAGTPPSIGNKAHDGPELRIPPQQVPSWSKEHSPDEPYGAPSVC